MRNREVERPFESWISLGDAGQWISGATPDTSHDSYWGGDVPWISASSLKNFDVIESERRLTRLGSMAGSQMAPPGSVIFVVRGMSLKNELRVGVAGRPVSFGQDCKVIIPRNDVDGRFLAYFMLSKGDHFVRTAEDAGHGTKRLVTSSVAEVHMPFPPVSEQRKIVEFLDALERAYSACAERIVKLALVRRGFSSSCMGSDSGTRKPLGDVLFGIESGKSPDVPGYPAAPGQWGVLKVSAVGSGGFVSTENKVVLDSSQVFRELEVLHGDLLMTRANTPDLVGMSCLVENPRRQLMMSDKILRLHVREDEADKKFVDFLLQSESARNKIGLLGTGSSGSMKNISRPEVRSLMFSWPDLEEQRRIVSIVRAHDERIAAERARLEKLRKLKTGFMDDLLTGRVRVDELQDLPV